MKLKWKRQQSGRELRDPIFGSPAGYNPKPHPLHTCETEDWYSAKLIRLDGRSPVYQGRIYFKGAEMKNMYIYCNLRDSKKTVEEGISELIAEQGKQVA